MASIPNLRTLLTTRRGPRLRGGRSRGGAGLDEHGHPLDEADQETLRDQVVQQTDNDASSSRMSAIALGYLQDPFARSFYPAGQEVTKRYPIINRGTYVRTTAIDLLVKQFLETDTNTPKQIISLGAGSDTRFFRICAGQTHVVYHELDFETNVIPKRTAIRASVELSRMTLPQDNGSRYHLHAIDLRDLTSKSPPAIPGLEVDLPTLILSECCLCYLPPDTASSVLQYFTMTLQSSTAIILYEPIRPFDAFGKTMVSNLASRGIHLQTLKRYYSLQAQRQRLRLAGFADGQGARDIHEIWTSPEWVSPAERERVEHLEWLDEVEEWELLASHYCIAWGWKGEVFARAWSHLPGDATSREGQDDMMM